MFKRLFIVCSIAILVFLGWYFVSTQPVVRLSVPPTDFEVKPGTSVDKIANDLSRSQLIRSRVAFKLTVLRLGIAGRIQAGLFRLSPSMSTLELVNSLTRAYAPQIRVTIPEGLRAEEINFLLETAFSKSPDPKYKSSEFNLLSKDLEGHLFPDTYDFSPEASASDVVSRLRKRFQEIVSELNIPETDLPKVVILASLLEREAATPAEMPMVAGVLQNRLQAGWPLQVDATVQYALGSLHCSKIDCDWWKKNLTKADLKLNSPFNTYLFPGLPPAPISNPGKSALSAALTPAKNPAWFYLHDSKGVIHFANTVEEHNRNICLHLNKDCP